MQLINYLPQFDKGCGACPYSMAGGWICVNPHRCQAAIMNIIMDIMVTDPGLRTIWAWADYKKTRKKRTDRKYKKSTLAEGM